MLKNYSSNKLIVRYLRDLQIDIKLAVKDSIGGWKDNAFIYKAPKACSSLKYLLGNSWTHIMNGFGWINITGCPIPSVRKYY